MRDLIGLTGYSHLPLVDLKQAALLFDGVCDMSGHHRLARLRRGGNDAAADELEWLIDRGFYTLGFGTGKHRTPRLGKFEGWIPPKPELLPIAEDFAREFEGLLSSSDDGPGKVMLEDLPPSKLVRVGSLELRYKAILFSSDDRDVRPVFPPAFDAPELFSGQSSGTTEVDVAELILHRFPVPAEDTPWEAIFEFRGDALSRASLADLRNWIGDVRRQRLSPGELVDKLEWLRSKYEQHLRLHRMSIGSGTLQTYVLPLAEAVENLVRLRLSAAVQALLGVSRKRAALYKAEIDAKGAELAYIVRADERFGSV